MIYKFRAQSLNEDTNQNISRYHNSQANGKQRWTLMAVQESKTSYQEIGKLAKFSLLIDDLAHTKGRMKCGELDQYRVYQRRSIS